MRCVLESLALAYRLVLERTEELTGYRFAGLHVVGGGTRNETLLQFTADAIGRPVWSGPAEATAIGNLARAAHGRRSDCQCRRGTRAGAGVVSHADV